jgi:hypothetical protein
MNSTSIATTPYPAPLLADGRHAEPRRRHPRAAGRPTHSSSTA